MHPEKAGSLEQDEVMGARYMLLETVKDLETIKEALCPEDDIDVRLFCLAAKIPEDRKEEAIFRLTEMVKGVVGPGVG